MSAPMRKNMPALRAVAGCMVLASLAACQHYAPNSRPERDSTEAITRAEAERIQARSASRAMAPSQIRSPTGFRQAEDGECRDWLDSCWESGDGRAQAADQRSVPELARLSRPAEQQTFRGMLPCVEDTLNCRGQRAVLTLASDRSWHARVDYVDAGGTTGAPSMLHGCWTRGAGNNREISLYLANGNPFTVLVAESSNNLVVVGTGDSSLRYTLTRQPAPDMVQKAPAASCPAT